MPRQSDQFARTQGGSSRSPIRWGSSHRGKVADLIVAARHRAGLTQLDVSAAIGVTRGQLANIETGRSDILLSRLMLIAAALKISARDLLPP